MKRSLRRLLSRASARRAALVMAATFGLPAAQAADLEDTQVAVTGTGNNDDLAISTAQNAAASLAAAEGGTLTATATGVDALAGDDTISGGIALTTSANAGAALLSLPDPGTVTATATGVAAGEGDDVVIGSLLFSTAATATGAYAGGIDWAAQNSTTPPEKKIDVGVTSAATATGIDTGEGDDSATNDGLFAVTALATSGGGAAPLSAETRESTEFKSTSTANATSTAFDTGAGSDTVNNRGVVNNLAIATSGALSVGLVAPQGAATDEKPGKTQIKSEATASATATSVGINADSDATEDSSEETDPFDLTGLRYVKEESSTAVSGNDRVQNHVLLNNSAIATSGAGSAAISNKVDGTLEATATAEATAESTGVTAGGGDDSVSNYGELRSNATATAGALSVSIDVGAPRADAPAPAPGDPPEPQEPSEDRENKSSSNTSVTATANATGIDTESGSSETLSRLAELSNGAIVLDERKASTAATGNDIVVNEGDMQTVATATVDSQNAAVTLSAGGSANAESTSNASAQATGVITGAGNDQVSNAGTFTVMASSQAQALTLALAAGNPSASAPPDGAAEPASSVSATSNTAVESEATAMGIDTEGDALSTVGTRHLEISREGIELSFGASQNGVAGNDTVSNTGRMTATAIADAAAGDFAASLGAAGSMSSEASAEATASSTLIYTGAGNDTVANSELLTSSSTATASAISIGITATQPAPTSADAESEPASVEVKAGSTASATNMGIDTEGSGHDNSSSTTLSLTRAGLELVRTRNDVSQSGADTVDNNGELRTSASASSGSVAGGAMIGAEGSVTADATANAEAANTAIHTGGGADGIDNTAQVGSTADATALSLALAITVTQPDSGSGPTPPAEPAEEEKSAKTQATANAEASARSTAIDAEGETSGEQTTDTLRINSQGLFAQRLINTISQGGDDRVANTGELGSTASATAGAGALGIAVQTGGTASANASATARASSGALHTGAGADDVSNEGELTSSATATSGAIALSLSVSKEAGSGANAVANASSDARAAGIATSAETASRDREFNLMLTRAGVQFTLTDVTRADQGADQITNSALIDSSATAVGGAVGGAIALDGAASAETQASATARADAIDAGGGADLIANSGQLRASAWSAAATLSVAVGQAGNERTRTEDKASASATASANAAGILADSGRDEDLELGLTISSSGLSAHADYLAVAASGDDTVSNEGDIGAIATATSGAGAGAVAIDGVAKAEVNSNSTGRAAGIDAGGGNDHVVNGGAVVANTTANALALAASVGSKSSSSGNARASVDANSKATAASSGITTDGAGGDQHIEGDLGINASGMTLNASLVSSAAAGDDQLDNRNSVTSHATANSGTVAVAVSIKGAANAAANSTATADATALDAGAGADLVDNSGVLDTEATATAAMLSAAISTEGRAVSNSGLMGAGTTATARAIGIAAAGVEATETLEIAENIDFDDIGVTLRIEHTKDGFSADGIDRVTNSGGITAHSTALAPRLTVGVTGRGTAVTMGRASAEASATGIDAGHLGDEIDNSAIINANADATAAMANASVTSKGLAVALNSVWDGGTEAQAVARGIDADGGESTRLLLEAEADADLARVRYTKEILAAAGNDVVRNSGAVNSTAFALSPSLNVAVSGQGVAAAVSTATAGADSIAIRGGDGDDLLDNEGDLTSTAEANAATANVSVTNNGVAAAADAVWDGGTKANATAIGLAGDGGDRSRSTVVSVGTDGVSRDKVSTLADGADTIDNGGDITATADSRALSLSVAVAVNGVGAATATSTSEATASAIDAGAGTSIDHVTNRGELSADAEALAAAASVSVTNTGLAVSADSVWDGGTKASSRARGIDVGAGGETILNEGGISAHATSTTLSASVAVTNTGVAAAVATATGVADSTAIDAGAGEDSDTVNNSGELHAGATANAASAAVTVTNSGLAIAADAVWDGGTGATARARGVDVGAAADEITNSGAVHADGEANALSASVAVAVNGVAAAVSTATSTSDVVALDAGAGDVRDVVTNSGRLFATSDANAAAVSVSFTMNGVALASGGAAWDGGTLANSDATGVLLGAGSDVISDTAGMESRATARSLGASAAIAVNGAAGAISAATADSRAVGIDAGAGDDDLTTSGGMLADSSATAVTVSVAGTQYGLAAAGNNSWDGGATSHSRATVLDGGAGVDSIDNSGALTSNASSVAPSVSVSFAVIGAALANSTATANADASAIDGGDNADDIDNRGALTVHADADAVAVNVAIAGGGIVVAADSVWDGGTTANALAHGIRGGAGNDAIDNLTTAAGIDSSASATAASVSVSITGAGFAASTSTSTANAEAAAIDAGEGNDNISNDSILRGAADATATSVSVSVVGNGGAMAADAFWDGGTHANANSSALAGGAGNDTLINNGAATADSDATTLSAAVAASLSGVGVSFASAASTSEADATVLSAGAGNDSVTNSAALRAESDSVADGVSVSFAAMGGSFAGAFDATTRAHATSIGLGGGDGVDQLTNLQGAGITLDAESRTRNVAVGVTLTGVSLAESNTESLTRGAGLDGGAGADVLRNAGNVGGTVSANASSLGVSVAAFGGALAEANSTARAEGAALAGGAGNDQLTNTGNVNLAFTANARGQSISAAIGALVVSEANAEAITDAAGQSGDAGADVLVNSGSLNVSSGTTTVAQSTGFAVYGYTVASANSIANANTAGLTGGADNDTLTNSATGVLNVRTGAQVTSNSLSIAVNGASDSAAQIIARGTATGLAGGAGNDTLGNAGAVNVTLNTNSTSDATSVSVIGAASARAGIETEAQARGLDGGAGDDVIANTGTVTVGPGSAPDSWMALLDAEGQSLSITGSSAAQSTTFARTASTGIDGGAGADQIRSEGAVNVRANALTQSISGSLNIFGSAAGGGEAGAFTRAAGIDGGAGNDTMASLAALNVNAESRLTQTSSSFTFGGGSSTDAALVARTEAVGLSGGDGSDSIAAASDIAVNAISLLNASGNSSTAFGSSGTAGTSGANTRATGIDGGAGDDLIDSTANITLTSNSTLSMSQSRYSFGGSGSNGGTLAAITESLGIGGGSGRDRIANDGLISIDARSTMNSAGDSETTFGGADDFITSGGITRASGISGGDDDDVIENCDCGAVNVTATTVLTVRSMAYSFASNGPSSGSVLTGDADASGLSGDAGNDRLVNRGEINVRASATLNNSGAASASFGGVGTGSSTGNSTVVASAKGLSGGDGDDWMGSDGDILVEATGTAESVNDASTDYASVVNDNEAGAVTRATVNATGIDGGAGANQAEVNAALTVRATSTSYSLANASGASFSFDNDAGARARSTAIANAIGVAGQAGDDRLILNSDASVTADASTAKDLVLRLTIRRDIRSDDPNVQLPAPLTVDALPPTADHAEDDVVFWTSSPADQQDPNNLADVDGGHYMLVAQTSGDPPTTTLVWDFIEGGLIQDFPFEVTLASFPSYAASNGSGLDGDGNANSDGIAIADARGITLGAGNNSILQSGELDVTATATGAMYTSADGDGWGHAQSEATGRAVATAIGLETGDGNDVITANGDVTVRAIPIAQARAHASSDTLCIWFFGWWCGDIGSGESHAVARLSGEAVGVRAGGGNNVITIGDSLTVISRPEIRIDASAGEFVTTALARDGEYNTISANSVAHGIDTGAGNDEVNNYGAIRVEAWDLGSDCDNNAGCFNPAVMTETLEATGIRTGAGNDIVRNLGTLSVETFRTVFDTAAGTRTLIRTSQVAIDTGLGDDQLFLDGSAVITGSVTLGDGNDTLDLRGNPVIRNSQGALLNLNAGAGIDTLVVNGAGSYTGAVQSIERAVKREAGTYTLPTLASMQSIAIEDGTLRVNSNYTFAPAGAYDTFFNVDGDSGVLSLSGNAALSGAIAVEKRGDTFVADGSRWNVVHADGAVSGDFTQIGLPESRPLLSFALERTARNVDVVASAPSFATVTENPLLQQIATNLDSVASGTSEDFANLFGRLQRMEGGFDRAFASFSPETHLATAGMALNYSRELNQALRLHLNESRTHYRLAPHTAAPDVAFTFSGGEGGIAGLQLGGVPIYALNELPAAPMPAGRAPKKRAQAWMVGISARADYDALQGYSAFDSSTQGFLFGADRRIGDEWLVGASVGVGETDVDVSDLASGGIDSWQANFYGTWFNDNWHVEGGIALGEQQFDNFRTLVVGSETRNASSRHDGNMWSAFLGGGARIGDDRLVLEPYVSFNYFSSDEDGFSETDASGMSQIVDSRRMSALIGEAGAKFSRIYQTERSLIDWHVNLGVNRNFGINGDEVSYSYVGAPGSMFSMDTRPTGESSLIYGAGVSFMRDLSAITLEYRGLENSEHTEEYLGARMTLRF